MDQCLAWCRCDHPRGGIRQWFSSLRMGGNVKYGDPTRLNSFPKWGLLASQSGDSLVAVMLRAAR